MSYSALIVAAGMSSRMGDFKPMLEIGSISIAKRVVANFHQAGINDIVMITGYNALQLERHLAGNGIVFLHNENYMATHMFDSAKIGLEYLSNKCDGVLFTPVDIPLFTSSSVIKLINSGYKLASPVCGGKTGHPIFIDSSIIPKILEDDGTDGLQGALSRCGEEMHLVKVNDRGILQDADTPEDFSNLVNYHNSQLIRPEIKVSLVKEIPFLDEKMVLLLNQIDETGSVRKACSRMQISYSTGWNVIKSLESQLAEPLINRTQGGAKGGKSNLTEYGKNIVRKYEAYSNELQKVSLELFDKYFDDLKK